jgi:hypothetical protein
MIYMQKVDELRRSTFSLYSPPFGPQNALHLTRTSSKLGLYSPEAADTINLSRFKGLGKPEGDGSPGCRGSVHQVLRLTMAHSLETGLLVVGLLLDEQPADIVPHLAGRP